LGADGTEHVASRDTNGNVRYAGAPALTGAGSTRGLLDLAVGPGGELAIVAVANGALYYTSRDPGSPFWNPQGVAGRDVHDPRVALPEGATHVFFLAGDPPRLFFWSGGGAPTDMNLHATRMAYAVAPGGASWVAFHDGSPAGDRRLRVASTVEEANATGEAPTVVTAIAFAIDVMGGQHLAYHDGENNRVRYGCRAAR
jgi:hypothetical protein